MAILVNLQRFTKILLIREEIVNQIVVYFQIRAFYREFIMLLNILSNEILKQKPKNYTSIPLQFYRIFPLLQIV